MVILKIMRIIEPRELERRKLYRLKASKSKRRFRPLRFLIPLTIIVYVSVSLLMPLEPLNANIDKLNMPVSAESPLPWPGYGQAAIGAVDYGLLASYGEQKPVPIASMAKVITALAVLKVKPMPPNSFGGNIAITDSDVATYFAYASQGQSVVRVAAGSEITQYQAFQALLLPSGNNMADILVRWAFGSTEEYLAFVNPFVSTLGMNNTTIADASGFSPQTVSTSEDMLKLAEIAINQPTIAEIVRQTQASLPTAGVVRSTNLQLGTAGIIGIKTGNTDQAGSCYMYAAERKTSDGQDVKLIGVVMGAPVLPVAMSASLTLIEDSLLRFKSVELFKPNQQLGEVSQKQGIEVPIVTKTPEPLLGWAGKNFIPTISYEKLSDHIAQGDKVATLNLQLADKQYEIELVAQEAIPVRNLSWRFRHLGGLL